MTADANNRDQLDRVQAAKAGERVRTALLGLAPENQRRVLAELLEEIEMTIKIK